MRQHSSYTNHARGAAVGYFKAVRRKKLKAVASGAFIEFVLYYLRLCRNTFVLMSTILKGILKCFIIQKEEIVSCFTWQLIHTYIFICSTRIDYIPVTHRVPFFLS